MFPKYFVLEANFSSDFPNVNIHPFYDYSEALDFYEKLNNTSENDISLFKRCFHSYNTI